MNYHPNTVSQVHVRESEYKLVGVVQLTQSATADIEVCNNNVMTAIG